MQYSQEIILKDGRKCLLKSCNGDNGAEMFALFNQTHLETDFLLSYADENSYDEVKEGEFLQEVFDSDDSLEIGAFLDGKLVASAGIEAGGKKYKVRHRAEFGISVLKDYWGLGIGSALTAACIDCALKAGYEQLELNAVAANASALNLYKKYGFVEYGRNSRGFKSRFSGYQEVVFMRLELN